MSTIRLKYCEHYNLPEHSYLLHIEIEAAGSTGGLPDPNILVVKDIPITALGSSSGSSTSAGSGSGNSLEGGSTADIEGASSNDDFTFELSSEEGLSEESSSVDEVEEGLSEENSSSLAEEGSQDMLLFESSGMDSSVAETSGPSLESSVFPAVPEFCSVANSKRILISIASLADMAVLPIISPGLNQLYRTDKVSVISNSKEMMDRLLAHIKKDVKTNARLQGLDNPYFETFEARDAVPGSTDSEDYPFR